MLLMLSEWLIELNPNFFVFHYLTLRAILSALTALLLGLLIGPFVIRKLSQYHIGQTIRSDGPSSHLSKSGTPTMGGLLILIAIAISVLLWADLSNRFVWVLMALLITLGILGGTDDYLKLSKRNSKGVSARWKLFWQSIIAFSVAWFLYATAQVAGETQLLVPFFKNYLFDLGLFSILLTYLVIVSSSNAVNLTDGLDGLAIMPIVMISGALGIFAYVTGNVIFSNYLLIPYVPEAGEVLIIATAIVGAGLGFLWYNAYPAQIFMGDIGSLTLGGLLGAMAVIVNQEIVFFIMAGVFVMETLSVILQVASYKLTGKRVFKMAPLHHHYELKGLAEPKVIVRFWIITFILVLVGLATLKLR